MEIQINTLNCSSIPPSDSESETETSDTDSGEAKTKSLYEKDGMIGSLERGLRTISRHARDYMKNCRSGQVKTDMQETLECSMLKMLKSEQILKELPVMVTEVIDEFVDGLDDDLDAEDEIGFFHPLASEQEADMKTLTSRIFQMFECKYQSYEKTLTKEKLKERPRFQKLVEDISYYKDAETNTDPILLVDHEKFECPEDEINARLGAAVHSITFQEEEESDDELMLPNIDPITKLPMHNPVRNRHCNHVFEEEAILRYICNNSSPKCPLSYCNNAKVLEASDFIKLTKLTEKVRQKNKMGRCTSSRATATTNWCKQ